MQPFVCPNKTNHFELRKTISKLYFGKTTVKEYNGLDFGSKDCFAVFSFEAIFQMIHYNAEVAFQKTVDL